MRTVKLVVPSVVLRGIPDYRAIPRVPITNTKLRPDGGEPCSIGADGEVVKLHGTIGALDTISTTVNVPDVETSIVVCADQPCSVRTHCKRRVRMFQDGKRLSCYGIPDTEASIVI